MRRLDRQLATGDGCVRNMQLLDLRRPMSQVVFTLEFLREVAHLRPRTNVIGAATGCGTRWRRLCGFGWIGYVSGSSAQPITLIALACISNGCPLAGEGTITAVASIAQPADSLRTSSV
jgi:hypothetical protein